MPQFKFYLVNRSTQTNILIFAILGHCTFDLIQTDIKNIQLFMQFLKRDASSPPKCLSVYHILEWIVFFLFIIKDKR